MTELELVRYVQSPEKMRLLSTVLPLLLVVTGCGVKQAGQGADAGVSVADAGPDETDKMFDSARVIEVDITMDEADWDSLRLQARGIDMFFGEDCQAEPFPKPYTYFSATVHVDGVEVKQTGVRKKGFLGSLDPNKPSLKLKFDEYVADQKVSGMKRMTLNNNRQDRSFIKQCIAYAVFRDAGIPAPRCNFAHVTVNGNDMGVFAHVESVKKPFLRRHFADDEGVLYEGTLSDFRDGWSGTFEQKTNKTEPTTAGLDAMRLALQSSDSELLAALEPIIDVDQFINFWAAEVLIAHWDGYANNTNNFYVYNDPTSGQLRFMPWGVDGVLADANPFPDGNDPPKVVYATGLLARRLYLLPETRTRYLNRLRELLAQVWNETALLAEVDRMEAQIRDIVTNDPFAEGVDVAAEIELVRDFIRNRNAILTAELDAPPTWDYVLRETFCFADVGTITGSFSTTYGDLNRDPFTVGTATVGGDIHGSTIVTTQQGSRAGLNAAAPNGPRVEIHALAWRDDGMLLFTVFSMPPGAFMAGLLTLDFGEVESFLYEYDPIADEGRVIGYLADGSLTLSSVSTTPGGQVTGTFTSTLIEFPF